MGYERDCMVKTYICKNCGHIQDCLGETNSTAATLWGICIGFTLFISIFTPVAWLVLGFEVLFFILAKNNMKNNCCLECRATGTMLPIKTVAGEEVYQAFKEKERKLKEQKEDQN